MYKDNGLKSRKLHMAYVVMLMMVGAYAAVGYCPALVPVFPELLTGLLAAASLYGGTNVLVKYLAGKQGHPPEAPPPVPPRK